MIQARGPYPLRMVILPMAKIAKNELKRMTKAKVADLFMENGCSIDTMEAGSVKYEAIALAGSDQRIGAIYGSRGGACALWLKDEAWKRVKGELDPEQTKVVDVKMFGRGFQWAIHFNGPDDPAIEPTVKAAVDAGNARWTRTKTRRATEERRARERVIREAKMAEQRQDPWA